MNEKKDSSINIEDEYNDYKKQAKIKNDPLWKYHQEKENQTIDRFSPEEDKIVNELTKKAHELGILGKIQMTIYNIGFIESKYDENTHIKEPGSFTVVLKEEYRSPEILINFYRKSIEEFELNLEKNKLTLEKLKLELESKFILKSKCNPKKQTKSISLEEWLK